MQTIWSIFSFEVALLISNTLSLRSEIYTFEKHTQVFSMQIKIGVCSWQLIAEKIYFLLWRWMVVHVNKPMGQSSSRSRDQPESYSIRIYFTISCMHVFFYLTLPFHRVIDTMWSCAWHFPVPTVFYRFYLTSIWAWSLF